MVMPLLECGTGCFVQAVVTEPPLLPPLLPLPLPLGYYHHNAVEDLYLTDYCDVANDKRLFQFTIIPERSVWWEEYLPVGSPLACTTRLVDVFEIRANCQDASSFRSAPWRHLRRRPLLHLPLLYYPSSFIIFHDFS
jgi:hypothetical protein